MILTGLIDHYTIETRLKRIGHGGYELLKKMVSVGLGHEFCRALHMRLLAYYNPATLSPIIQTFSLQYVIAFWATQVTNK